MTVREVARFVPGDVLGGIVTKDLKVLWEGKMISIQMDQIDALFDSEVEVICPMGIPQCETVPDFGCVVVHPILTFTIKEERE